MNLLVTAQTLRAKQKMLFHAFMNVLAEPLASLSKSCMLFLLTHPVSSVQNIAFPRWQPSWVWYRLEVPALFTVAGNPVPALTLLSGSSHSKRKKPLSEPLWRRDLFSGV